MITELVQALLKRWGSSAWKQRVWDQEYSLGLWARPHHGAEGGTGQRDSVLGVIEKYAGGGEILELGCGAGETAFEIADNFQHYVGVDISDVAIRRGIETKEQDPSRSRKMTLIVGDISTFVPDGRYSVILFRESIYYIPLSKIPATLKRLGSFLAPEGVFIVRVHDRTKFKKILDMIDEDYRVLERTLPERAATATLVFEPKVRESSGVLPPGT